MIVFHNLSPQVCINIKTVWWRSTFLFSLPWPWRSMRVLYSRGRAAASAQVLCSHAAQSNWTLGACTANPWHWSWCRHPTADGKWTWHRMGPGLLECWWFVYYVWRRIDAWRIIKFRSRWWSTVFWTDKWAITVSIFIKRQAEVALFPLKIEGC